MATWAESQHIQPTFARCLLALPLPANLPFLPQSFHSPHLSTLYVGSREMPSGPPYNFLMEIPLENLFKPPYRSSEVPYQCHMM